MKDEYTLTTPEWDRTVTFVPPTEKTRAKLVFKFWIGADRDQHRKPDYIIEEYEGGQVLKYFEGKPIPKPE